MPSSTGSRRLRASIASTGFDDEEEDGRRDREELDHVGEERAVPEDGVIDREGEVGEVRLPDDRGDHGHDEVLRAS